MRAFKANNMKLKRFVYEYANELKRQLPKGHEKIKEIDRWVKCGEKGFADNLKIMTVLHRTQVEIYDLKCNKEI